jgi:exodeoxyribonuclease VII large subunit
LVIPQKRDLQQRVKDCVAKLNRALKDFIPQHKQRIDNFLDSMRRAMEVILKEKRNQFEMEIAKLEQLNPLGILRRGYSVTLKMPQEEILADAKLLHVGERIKTKLHKGSVLSVVEGIDDKV